MSVHDEEVDSSGFCIGMSGTLRSMLDDGPCSYHFGWKLGGLTVNLVGYCSLHEPTASQSVFRERLDGSCSACGRVNVSRSDEVNGRRGSADADPVMGSLMTLAWMCVAAAPLHDG
jgi:hypothetical protein